MLTEGEIEGEVRDFDGKVLWKYAPKKPLAMRLDEARKRAQRAQLEMNKAQANLRRAEFQRMRLEKLAAEQVQPTPQLGLLIGGEP